MIEVQKSFLNQMMKFLTKRKVRIKLKTIIGMQRKKKRTKSQIHLDHQNLQVVVVNQAFIKKSV